MAVIHDCSLSLDRFHWDRVSGVLIAEASDFGPLRDGYWWLRQIWDDSADVGISIRSHVTGVVELFYLDHEVYYGSEREFAGWCFKPVNPKCPVKIVSIHND